jgi:hypothetical protein
VPGSGAEEYTVFASEWWGAGDVYGFFPVSRVLGRGREAVAWDEELDEWMHADGDCV